MSTHVRSSINGWKSSFMTTFTHCCKIKSPIVYIRIYTSPKEYFEYSYPLILHRKNKIRQNAKHYQIFLFPSQKFVWDRKHFPIHTHFPYKTSIKLTNQYQAFSLEYVPKT